MFLKIENFLICIFCIYYCLPNNSADNDDEFNDVNCVLPEQLEHGEWFFYSPTSPYIYANNKVSPGTVLRVICDKKYWADGPTFIVCTDGQWSANLAQCRSLCPSILSSHTMKVTCRFKGRRTENCTKPVAGTIARFQCAPFYEKYNNIKDSYLVCKNNGNWNQPIPECVPTCGIKKSVKELFGHNGPASYSPWQAVVFYQYLNGFSFRCAGTLISERVVLTDAECAQFISDVLIPDNNKYLIAVGQFSRNFKVTDSHVQTSKIVAKFVPAHYKGKDTNYEGSIAIFITEKLFTLSERVLPACVDWAGDYENVLLHKGITGVIKGWTTNEVNEHNLTTIRDEECEIAHPAEENKIAEDKICSSNFIAVTCSHHFSSGFVVKNPYDHKYYIAGVTSLIWKKNKDNKNCEPTEKYAIFTKILSYTKFILEKINAYNPSITTLYYEKLCGIPNQLNQSQPLIVGGNKAPKNKYPWQAAIYSKENTRKNKQLICSGTIISEKVILTAAHCITDSKGNMKPKRHYIVAVGKYYRNADDDRDADAQFSAVSAMYIPDQYQGESLHYIADVAVIVTKKSFIFSRIVRKICIDWDGKYEKILMKTNVTALVAGWGYEEEDASPAEELKEIDLPYVDTEQCKKELPPNFTPYLTFDKMCFGHLNQSQSLCLGDSGSSLVIKSSNDNRLYAIGIVSVAPQAPTGGCNSQQYSLHTRLSFYITSFIKEKVSTFIK